MSKRDHNIARRYDIRIQRDGQGWMNEKQYAQGVNGQLPEQWDQLKQEPDPDIQKAVIFHCSQRHKWSNQRQILDSYERS